MKNILPAILIIALGIGIYMYMKKEPLITNRDSTGTTVVAFGDSLVSGVGTTSGRDFVSLISENIGEPVINMGVSGNTSSLGLARIDTVIAQDPRLVLVLFGGNDFLRGVPIEETFQNLEQIIIGLQDAGAMVMLLGVRGGILNDTYANRFETLSRTHNTLFVPNVLQGVIGNQGLMNDAIHPNDAGHKIIADRILKEIESVL